MAYPNIFLTRPKRLAIMISLIVAFFVISPTLILYTAGYSIDLENMRIVKSGVISVDASPKDLTVTINDKVINKSLPLRLPNTLPDAYSIMLSQEGYHSWTKDIVLEPQKTYYIKDVSLYKQSNPERIYSLPTKNTEVIFSPDGMNALIVVANNGMYEIKRLDLSTLQLSQIYSDKLITKPMYFWNQESTYLHVVLPQSDGTQVTSLSLIDNKIKSLSFEDVSTLLPGNEDIYYLQDDRVIHKIENNIQEFFARLQLNTSSWFVRDQQLYEIDGDKLTTGNKTYTAKTKIGTILEFPDSKTFITKENGSIKRFTLDGSVAVLSGTYTYDVIQKDTITGGYMLISGLETLWFSPSSPETTLLSRFSKRYTDVIRQNTTGDFFVTDGSKITGFNSGYGVKTDLVNGRILKMSHSAQNKKIHFFGSVEKTTGIFAVDY